MEPNPAWEAASCAVTQDFPNILWDPKVYYLSHKSLSLVSEVLCNILYGKELLSLRPTPKLKDPPFLSCPRLFIHYIRSYSPHLEAVSSIRNLRTRHALVTWDPPNMIYFTLLRMRDSVTSNNGFWIRRLDLLALLLQLQQIVTVHNQWQSETRSIPYRTTMSVFSSTVTDLVLIYESVTSSASVVRWLTLHTELFHEPIYDCMILLCTAPSVTMENVCRLAVPRTELVFMDLPS
jgi:hypothetical protein